MDLLKFLKYCKNNCYSVNTIKSYKSILSQYQENYFDIRLIKRKLMSYFNSPNTVWTHYNVLVSYMKWKNDSRHLKLKQFKMPPIPKKYMPVFNKQFLEKKTNITVLDDEKTKKKKTLIKFLFETGIRASELQNIQQINKDTILVKGKGLKIREIFHNHQTTSLLQSFVFTTKTLRLWVKSILGQQFTPHSIRRSHATHMLLRGANPKVVMMQLGHEKVETTFRYLQICKKTNKKIYLKYF